jgi:hypothetical protein
VGRLTKLVRFLLRANALTGSLPSELGNTRIKDIFWDGNQLEVRLRSWREVGCG